MIILKFKFLACGALHTSKEYTKRRIKTAAPSKAAETGFGMRVSAVHSDPSETQLPGYAAWRRSWRRCQL